MIKELLLLMKLSDKEPLKAFLTILYNNLVRINRFVIFEFDLEQEFASSSIHPDFLIKILHHKDLEQYLPKERGNLPREFDMHKIHGVERCVVVLREDQIVHISWIYIKGDPNRWFDLKDDEASISYSFTMPDFRGKRLFPQTILFVAWWLKDRGFRRILEAPNANTIFTLKSFSKIPNFKEVGTLVQWFVYRPKYKG